MCKGMCVSVCEGVCVYAHLHVYVFIIIYIYIYIYMLWFETEKGSLGDFSESVCSSCKRKFVAYPLVDEKQTEVIRLQTN